MSFRLARLSQPDRLRGLCVVLVSARNPLNIGAAARAMSNFGFFDLRVVNPHDASFREARSAVGAAEVLARAQEYANVAGAVADCSLVVGTTAAARREMQHPLRRLEAGARLIRQRIARGRVALLFGSEKRGLSNDDLSHCHWLLRIPARPEHGSMNLGQAVAVCLYELTRNRRLKPVNGMAPPAPAKRTGEISVFQKTKEDEDKEASTEPATSAALERITTTLGDALRASGYLNERTAAAGDEKIRRMVRRLKLSAADADLLLGMARQIAWKLRISAG